MTPAAAEPLDSGPAQRLAWLAWVCAGGWTLSSVLSRTLGMWSAVGGAALVLGLLILAVDRKRLAPQLRVTPGGLAIGTVAGLLMAAATYLLYPLAGRLVPQVVPEAAVLYTTFGGAGGVGTAVALSLVILGEDLVWRAVVQDYLCQRWGPRLGLVLAVLAYGAAVAATGLWLLVLIALACGAYWSLLKAWTRSLVPVLAAHLVWDVLVILVHPLVKTG